MKKTTFGVIVLNYCSFQETLNCVDTFKKANDNEYIVHYVIVDNGSDNESYDVLSNKYKYDENVDIVKLENNVGFAKGNNAGLKFLDARYSCDYYIFSNSDIIVNLDIFSWIDTTYKKTNCDILGPDIYAEKLGIHQNPIKTYTENPLIITLKIIKKWFELLALRIHMPWPQRPLTSINNEVVLEKKIITNCPLHGSFIITNDKFLNYYKDFFDDRTFLYMEEYLLYLRCKRAKLKIVVSLDHQVIHLQGKSTDANMNDIRKKRINRLLREISSMRIYRDEVCKRKNVIL